MECLALGNTSQATGSGTLKPANYRCRKFCWPLPQHQFSDQGCREYRFGELD